MFNKILNCILIINNDTNNKTLFFRTKKPAEYPYREAK